MKKKMLVLYEKFHKIELIKKNKKMNKMKNKKKSNNKNKKKNNNKNKKKNNNKR
jgi:hypothetical protein